MDFCLDEKCSGDRKPRTTATIFHHTEINGKPAVGFIFQFAERNKALGGLHSYHLTFRVPEQPTEYQGIKVHSLPPFDIEP